MDELKAQQIEALQTAEPYCEKIASAIEKIIGEYTTEKLPDTEEYMKSILNGLNWIFSVYNGTEDLVNAGEVVVDKKAVNQAVMAFNEASKAGNDLAKAEALKGILAFVKTFENAAKKLCA
ncbi:MAG: hypothetical protein PHW47_12760 [Lachnospira sp.]|nr:hypothetical protein [Lachnospira sp.]